MRNIFHRAEKAGAQPSDMSRMIGGVLVPDDTIDSALLDLTPFESIKARENRHNKRDIRPRTPSDERAEQKSATYLRTHSAGGTNQSDASQHISATEILREDALDGFIVSTIDSLGDGAPESVIASAERRYPSHAAEHRRPSRAAVELGSSAVRHAEVGGFIKTISE